MKLNELRDNPGARKDSKRLGRGIGSGKGKTGGRGVKGQKARTGVAVRTFEGGQTPIYMRLPKRGFNNVNRTEFATINLGDLQRFIEKGRLDPKKPVTEAVLFDSGLLARNKNGVKLLAKGELKEKLTIEVAKASQAAVAAVEKLGGSITAPAQGQAVATEPKAKAESKAKPAAKKTAEAKPKAEKKAPAAEKPAKKPAAKKTGAAKPAADQE